LAFFRSYVLTLTTLDKDLGIALLNRAMDVIKTTITAKGGKMEIKMAPKIVGDREENELKNLIERMALENEEVDGDEPEDD